MSAWFDRLGEIHTKLKEKYPEADLSEVTTPLENDHELTPVEAYTEAFLQGMVYRDWDNVDKIGGEFVWAGNIKQNFPLFTTMVELIALAADEHLKGI